MPLDPAEAALRLAAYLQARWGAAEVSVERLEKLGGGAIQENWALDIAARGGAQPGSHALVLRTDAPTGLAVSLSRIEEFALLAAAYAAGVTVPEPILAESDASVVGAPFCLMRRVAGTAIGRKVVRDLAPKLGGDVLAERLGRELAGIHTITPATHRFPFLPPPASDAAAEALARLHGYMDALPPRPVLEWGLRWLDRHRPPPGDVTLVHHDFRTGNYMLSEEGLTGILDWEFAGWSDPYEDLGWFCAACWRFGQREREAGGIGSREAFYRGYEAESGRMVDRERVHFWEVFAHLRWAVIALQQGERFSRQGERSLDLALTGRRAVEMEWEILTMTAPAVQAEAAPLAPMHDEPVGADLLDLAAEALQRQVLPALGADLRLEALRVVAALGIAGRELRAAGADDPAGETAALAAAIRGGSHDDDPGVHAALLADTRRRLAIANPGYLAGASG